MDYRNLGCENISSNTVFNGDWFIGSALASIPFKTLECGKYYYEQDTVWTRMLDVKEINLYWETHNESMNFLSICKTTESYDYRLINDVLNEIQLNRSKIIAVTSDKLISHSIEGIKYIENKHMPFYIDKEQVGTYTKFFYINDFKYSPIFDVALFELDGEYYTDINMNKAYLEMTSYQLDNVYCTSKYKTVVDRFKFNVSNEALLEDLSGNQIIPLLETIAFIQKYNIPINSSYSGHIVKKMLKKIAIKSILVGLKEEDLIGFLSEDYFQFVYEEKNKIYQYDYEKIKDISKVKLTDTYGITEEVFNYLSGDSRNAGIREELLYFTDIPLLKINSNESFGEMIDVILSKKYT
ncbi:hypothetical protein HB852_07185 [Listeria grandensis]|uniref:hypothetical protein n=1 Tax=Listeria grandensis TaxID=1494963 RepID=UPI00162626B2|nr:hypothetical protein [Listeria grandensis]MBC1474398.1 hypothetical protein [Listeria grandensis]